MTSRPFTQEQILGAKENAYIYGVRAEIPNGVAITFLFWRARQDCPSHDQVKGYWAEFYELVEQEA